MAVFSIAASGEPGESLSLATCVGLDSNLYPCEEQVKANGEIKPFGVENISHAWGSISADKTPIVTQLTLSGDNLPEALLSIVCRIYLNHVNVFEGEIKDFSLEKIGSNYIVRFISELDNNDEHISEWWISHIKNTEQTTVRMEGALQMSRGSGYIFHPFVWENEFQTDMLKGVNAEDVRTINFGIYRLEVQSLRSKWGEITPESTRIEHTLKIHNPSLLPGTPIINRMKYELFLNGITMTVGTLDIPLFILSGETRTVTFTSEINREKIQEWWISHIQCHEQSSYLLRYTLFIEVLGITLARWPEELSEFFYTDFLGTRKE